MARSHSIHVVLRTDGPWDSRPYVEAAFTVKHELDSWLERNTIPGDSYRNVVKLRDGGR